MHRGLDWAFESELYGKIYNENSTSILSVVLVEAVWFLLVHI